MAIEQHHRIGLHWLDTPPKVEAYLLQRGVIEEAQVELARKRARIARRPVQEMLLAMGAVTDEQVCDALAELMEVQPAELEEDDVRQEAVGSIPFTLARKYAALPLTFDEEDGSLIVAMANPIDMMALDDLQAFADQVVTPVLAPRAKIIELIDKVYFLDENLYAMMRDVVGAEDMEVLKAEPQQVAVEELKIQSEMAPIIRLSSLIISDAVKLGASDIHIEPQEHYVQLRYRLDGLLKNVMQIPKTFQDSLISRMKIVASMDIAERRKPQDGRAKVMFQRRICDLRVSTLPTYFGEKVVIRILMQNDAQTNLETVGFQPEELDIWQHILAQPQGMILLTGPTGSGKTTTLYASLSRLKSETRNIVTLEDPVEYQIEGLNQVQINPLAGVTFARGLRSILRQDPDVILVGEIRDRETAEIAFQAAMTGHLVLSTLHTNDAASAVTRLIDIGVPHFLVSSSVLAVAAQRLVRCICPHCQEEYTPDSGLLELYRPFLGAEAHTFHRGVGCEKCNYTGYRGRTAIFEILRLSNAVKRLIRHETNELQVNEVARNEGMCSLAEAAVRKVLDGVTTLEECSRVAFRTDDNLQLCPSCHNRVQREFDVCPYCTHVFRLKCPGCSKEVKSDWTMCPFCSENLTPVIEALQAAAPAHGPVLSTRGEATCVLIVHGNAKAGREWAAGFESVGHDTAVVETIDDARAFLQKHAALALVLDTPPDDESAFKFCQELRTRLDTSVTPIFLCTTEALSETERSRYSRYGADDYLAGSDAPARAVDRLEDVLELQNTVTADITASRRNVALTEELAATARRLQEEPAPVEAAAYARLRVLGGGPPGQTYDLRDDSVTIGRAPNNTLQIETNNISRYHAQILRENGRIVIRDSQSTVGTLVNGAKIAEIELRDGDEVRIGDLLLSYESVLAPAPPTGSNDVS